MYVIDLVNVDPSKIKINKYPDGQRDLIVLQRPPDDETIVIKSHFNNFEDLNLIICAKRSLAWFYLKNDIELYVPYLLGARADLPFEQGQAAYLRDVIAPIINSLNFSRVTVYDPHSIATINVINNLRIVTNEAFVEWSLTQWNLNINDVILVSPDGGAIKKTEKVASLLGYEGEIIFASKHREHGKGITRTDVPLGLTLEKNKPYIIIDDICDGGRTFIEIAKVISNHPMYDTNIHKIFLCVSHGIFSNGFSQLETYFNGVSSTNSYRDIVDSGNWFEQLNVF